jgi:uncharacterized protein YqgC (DUF456 family)
MILVLGIILNIVGIIGVVMPAMPGIVLNFAALILLYIDRGEQAVGLNVLIMFGFLSFLASTLDYILPLLGAKKFGASRSGIGGAVVGMIIGILFFPPIGLFAGLLLGAFAGELLAGKDYSRAFKAGFATFLGSLTSIAVKLTLALVMTFYYLWHLF